MCCHAPAAKYISFHQPHEAKPSHFLSLAKKEIGCSFTRLIHCLAETASFIRHEHHADHMHFKNLGAHCCWLSSVSAEQERKDETCNFMSDEFDLPDAAHCKLF
jgi:hypothetical protein